MSAPRRTVSVRLVLLAVLAAGCGPPSGGETAPRVRLDRAGERYDPAVVIDGRFDDWEVGESAAGSSAVLEIRDDPGAVYLAIPLPRPDNIQGLDGAIVLALDADGDSTTGHRAFDLPGTDLVVSFTRLVAAGDPQHGIAWWRPAPADPDRVFEPSGAGTPHELGLWFEPRHTSDRVELRLARTRPDARYWTGSGFSGRLLYFDRDGSQQGATPPFHHALRTDRGMVAESGPVDLQRPDGTDFRLVSWNVSRERIVRDPEAARRILSALRPDLVLLDEVPPGVTPAEIEALLPGDGPAWSVHTGTSGSRQRGAIAIRGGVSAEPSFERVAYPDSMTDLLSGRRSATLREVASNVTSGGVPVSGAWVSSGDRRWLAVTLDLVCCGNSITSVEDRIRRIEAQAINGAARNALDSGGSSDPAGGGQRPSVIVGGDFNLVGSHRPLDAVAAGLGPDGTDLEVVYALQLDGATSATWGSARGPFPPGQLDYVLYPPGRLTPLRAFVFETPDLSSSQLGELGLEIGDSDRASDHLPVVVDFVWRQVP